MPIYDREQTILYTLEDGELTVAELAKRLYVSEPTIRRDLTALSKKGVLIRTYGGAKLSKTASNEQIPLFFREQEHNEAKSIIAQKAVKLIKDGDTIMLDATTTAYHLLPNLAQLKNIVVITSGAKASFMLGKMGINNISTGGQMIIKSFSFVGDNAVQTVKKYNADIAFVSCHGISADGKVTDNSINENVVRNAMLCNAKIKVLLCDSSKFDKTCLNNLCDISNFDYVISDVKLPQNLTYLLKNPISI